MDEIVEAPVPLALGRARRSGLGTSLSPSRAGDFMTCPLLYRFRTVDQLAEKPSLDALRGTLVHKVLEVLFDLPAADRTLENACQLLGPSWKEMLDHEPHVAELFTHSSVSGMAVQAPAPDLSAWLASCEQRLARYFDVEDPRFLEPAEREVYVEFELPTQLTLRGVIDRVDVASDGKVRVVDYKTGRAPGPAFEARSLFQMKFYALVWWRIHGDIPAMLQLIYLGSGEVLRYAPDEADLLALERKVGALWQAIKRAETTGQWLPRKSALCGWCSFQDLCPEFGGTPPPLPVRSAGDCQVATVG